MESVEIAVQDEARGLDLPDNRMGALVARGDMQGASAVAREEAEIKAAVFLAKQFPRNENEAFKKIIRALARPTLAENATYSYPRGGSTITGPSVYLARELARAWCNMRHGIRIISVDEEYVHIRGWALDVENNGYTEAEDRFLRRVQRKVKGSSKTEWVEPDERDLRELVNKRGAILVRNCILELIPSDVVDEAVGQAADTLRKKAKGELTENREDVVRRLVISFDAIGVTVSSLEAYLEHGLDALTGDELTQLRQIMKSIRDGQSSVASHFDQNAGAAAAKDDLKERLKKSKKEEPKKEEPKKKEAKPEPEPEQEPEESEEGETLQAAPADEEPSDLDLAIDRLKTLITDIKPEGGDAKPALRKKVEEELDKVPVTPVLSGKIRKLLKDKALGAKQANAIFARLAMAAVAAEEAEGEAEDAGPKNLDDLLGE